MNSQFANLLTENDITLTKQRLEIAELIFVKDQHFTAIELIEKVKKSKK